MYETTALFKTLKNRGIASTLKECKNYFTDLKNGFQFLKTGHNEVGSIKDCYGVFNHSVLRCTQNPVFVSFGGIIKEIGYTHTEIMHPNGYGIGVLYRGNH